ncbi:MAG TPA: excalibur calcium-binding domain-containing protein, partial [Candidatus Polarisedimenticolia bacterium]|nr:excalibur calcium-binding domain-containing protein [Candidatus Polarisedimenticolia bacterium]
MKFILAAVLAAIPLALTPSASAATAAAADLDCADFATQASAQSYFLSRGGPANDPDRLDSDGDGIACETNPCPCSYSTTPTTPPPTPPATPPAEADPPARMRFQAIVTAVVDGDTIRVRRGTHRQYTVRLIGIDTPETKKRATAVECGGPEATSNMFRLGFTRPRDS